MPQDNLLLDYKTFYEYDDASMRKRFYIQPSAGGTTVYDVNYTYDEASRLISVKDAVTAKTASYAYFDIGALKTVTNPNGITAHRSLDALNRLDTLQYKTDAATVLSLLDYTYDDRSNVSQLVRDDTGAGGSSQTFSFGYDGISRLTSANYGNETISYTYDKSGNRLTQVSSVDGTTTYTVAANSNQLTHRSLVPEDTDFSTMNYTYDAEGKLTQRSEDNDSDAFTYGFGSQLKQIQKTRNNAVTQTISYAYDGGGKRVKVTDSQGTRYFLYDGLMPVLELDAGKNITASYLYGANGVVYRRKPVAAAHWHFDEGKGTVAVDVDNRNDGTLGGGDANKAPAWSSEKGGSLLFDGTDDLVKVPDSDGLDFVGDTLTISCWVKRASPASGNLVMKADASSGYRLWILRHGAVRFEVVINGTTHTVTSGKWIPVNAWRHVCARFNNRKLRVYINGKSDATSFPFNGSLTATAEPLYLGYYDGTDHHLQGYLDDVSIYHRSLTNGEIKRLWHSQAGRYEYHHANALGSNIVLTDDNKNVLVRYEYDVFGAVRSEVGTSDNTRKFTGKEYESDVKLYHFPGRPVGYDPYIGRFNQQDPAGDGINWYAYANNNPLAFIDPTGLAFRSATDAELSVFREAAVFSFGETNGAALMDFVTVRFGTPDEAEIAVGDVSARGSYDSGLNRITIYAQDLDNVELHLVRRSTFVHELTHAWQDVTLYQNPSGSGSPNPNDEYEHTIFQLFFRRLNSEQMARAVQNHYHAMHSNPDTFGRAGYVFSWWVNAGGAADDYLSHEEMVNIASSVLYVPLLNMIREPLIGAATWGGIRGGR